MWDHWYQAKVIRDDFDSIGAVFGRQSGKSDCISRREDYNGAINTLDDMGAILVAPAQRQSDNLYGRCTKYLNRSPILLSMLKQGRVLQKGIEFQNGYTIINMPIGTNADKARGFSIDELVFEEAAYIPGKAYDALTDSLLSTEGVEIRIGTPNGKANPLYMAYENAFRIHTIPQEKWESWNITEADSITLRMENVDMDDAWSCHHYPSHVGLNVFKDFKVYPVETWEVELESNRRFQKQHRGWRVFKTEDQQYIGQLLTDHYDLIDKLPQETRIRYKNIHDLIGDETVVHVGVPQISSKRLKKAMKRTRSTVERENLALFSEEDGVVFPYNLVLRAFRSIPLLIKPIQGYTYYGGLDLAKGVQRDWSVITIVGFRPQQPRIRLFHQWKSNRRRIKEARKELLRLHPIWNVQKWYIDANTIGSETVEELKDVLGSNRIDGIGFQTKDKADMVANMELLLGDEASHCDVEIPDILEDLLHQFKFYSKENTVDGTKLKYSHPDWEGEHDDELDSFMLACLCARATPTYDLKYILMPKI